MIVYQVCLCFYLTSTGPETIFRIVFASQSVVLQFLRHNWEISAYCENAIRQLSGLINILINSIIYI